jgi:hypothetical protein
LGKGNDAMKNAVKKIPLLGPLAVMVYRKWIRPFPGSANYWQQRYESCGNSGSGSYSELAEFKAEIINSFVRANTIETVIEHGCGDGNQLRLAEYPSYLGFDVSQAAVTRCREIFSNDTTKKFKLSSEYNGEKSQLALSLDVVYHLVENNVFESYMEVLFKSSERFVIIYSSNTNDNQGNEATHVKHRKFSEWIEQNEVGWRLKEYIPNRYPCMSGKGSFADFYIYEKSGQE